MMMMMMMMSGQREAALKKILPIALFRIN